MTHGGGQLGRGVCQIRMFNSGVCGRPIYGQIGGVEKSPVCLMHSHNPSKNPRDFLAEFERILADAGTGVANFAGFVFPDESLPTRKFIAECIFNDAEFLGFADFLGSEFANRVVFSQTVFRKHAAFTGATFEKDAVFAWASFLRGAEFGAATFRQIAQFQEAQFAGPVQFRGTEFDRDAIFKSAYFEAEAYFGGLMAVYGAGVDAPFDKDRLFRPTVFKGEVNFHGAAFMGRVEFRETRFDIASSRKHRMIFTSVHLERPSRVVFYKTDLRTALLHNSDVSEVVFSNVLWRRRANGKKMVLEEECSTSPTEEVTEALLAKEESPDTRNYGLIEELYQQLKKNYDDKRDYRTAGDFHYGEMEMKRLATPPRNAATRWLKGKGITGQRFDAVRAWWHKRLSPIAWYRYASEYGESYSRPVLWLGVILISFALLYPIAGLDLAASSRTGRALSDVSTIEVSHPSAMSYSRAFGCAQRPSPCAGLTVTFGHSLMTAIGVAAFRRNIQYEPAYPWGRLLSILEIVLTSSLLALFLLALRRQFKR